MRSNPAAAGLLILSRTSPTSGSEGEGVQDQFRQSKLTTFANVVCQFLRLNKFNRNYFLFFLLFCIAIERPVEQTGRYVKKLLKKIFCLT